MTSPMDSKLAADAKRLLAHKVRTQQHGVPTFFDNWLGRCLDYQGADAAMLARRDATVAEFLRTYAQSRLQSWPDRHATTSGRSALPPIALIHSQGVPRVPQWKGLPLFKSVFDLSIYQQLLAELRPRHIVELGSGSGASAIWLRDMAAAIYGPVEVISADIAPPNVEEHHIRFRRCDCRDARAVGALLDSIERQGALLLIEDAHHGVDVVLEQAHARLAPGDYLIVEDSQGKQDTLGKSPLAVKADYAVDTRFTDLFGTNVTSCIDSIFVRLPARAGFA